MVEYALNDVNYLLEMGDMIVAGLKEKGRYDWFEESCLAARQKVLDRDDSKEESWRVQGSGKLDGYGLACLRAIWQWRDAEAKAWDKPSFMVAPNRQLLEWSIDLAAKKSELGYFVLLDEEQRTEKISHLDTWRQQIHQARGKIDQLQKQLQRGEALLVARKKIDTLQKQQDSWELEKRHHAPVLSRLAFHQKTQPFSAKLAELESAIAQQQTSGRLMQQAAENRRDFHQQWLTTLGQALAFANDAVNKMEHHCNELQESLDAVASDNRTWESWLHEHGHNEALTDSLPTLIRKSHELHSLSEMLRQVQAQLESLQSARQKMQQTFQTLTSEHAEKSAAFAAVKTALDSSYQTLREELITLHVEDASVALQQI
jgi:methyl-accepting chemotaxis protein